MLLRPGAVSWRDGVSSRGKGRWRTHRRTFVCRVARPSIASFARRGGVLQWERRGEGQRGKVWLCSRAAWVTWGGCMIEVLEWWFSDGLRIIVL